MKKLKKNLFIVTILSFSLLSCTQSCKQKVSHELGMFFYNASSEKPILDSLASIPDPIELEQKSIETRIPCK
jgi:hypothetical protein